MLCVCGLGRSQTLLSKRGGGPGVVVFLKYLVLLLLVIGCLVAFLGVFGVLFVFLCEGCADVLCCLPAAL